MQGTISVRVDSTIKGQAEKTLESIGLNMSTYITSSLKALVREQKVPFELSTVQLANAKYLQKLDDSLEEARNGEVYQYFGKGKFKKASKKLNI